MSVLDMGFAILKIICLILKEFMVLEGMIK